MRSTLKPGSASEPAFAEHNVLRGYAAVIEEELTPLLAVHEVGRRGEVKPGESRSTITEPIPPYAGTEPYVHQEMLLASGLLVENTFDPLIR